MPFFCTSVANIRRFDKPAAFFFLEVFAVLVADRAGRTVAVTDDDPVTDIRTFATKPFGTEVVWVIEYLFWLDIIHSMEADFFGYGSRILTKKSGNVFEGSTFVQLGFDVFPVRQGEVFLVAWN